jgi:hypothetical protein
VAFGGRRRGRGKFGSIRTKVDGITFHSKGEAYRYVELKHLLAAGEICNLELQVPFSLDIGEVHICKYLADFCYLERAPGGLWRPVVEDFKGKKGKGGGIMTDVYKLKRKLMKAIHGIEIRET